MSAQHVYAAGDDDADIERRFRAAGVIVPADRAAGTYAGARRLLALLHWVHEPRGAEVEPAHVFSARDQDRPR